MNKKLALCALSLVLPYQASATGQRTISANSVAVILAGITTASLMSGWLVSRLTFGPWIVNKALARYTPEITALNTFGWHAQNSYGWNEAYEHQLRESIKMQALQWHNMNRDKWRLNVLFDQLSGMPAGIIKAEYYNYPLINYMEDLDWFIANLRIICALRLHHNHTVTSTLLYQLTYIRGLLEHDIDLHNQRAAWQQAMQPA